MRKNDGYMPLIVLNHETARKKMKKRKKEKNIGE